ncbi:uncharacterized protein LOC135378415 isoform X2 [Ornithodoros turicata]|uniref:uncharacterized protein LOC135378415 isoform X2 n=1 Tax=Ornithodoros turicata TaxID=34597 RepID=UPI00313A00F4
MCGGPPEDVPHYTPVVVPSATTEPDVEENTTKNETEPETTTGEPTTLHISYIAARIAELSAKRKLAVTRARYEDQRGLPVEVHNGDKNADHPSPSLSILSEDMTRTRCLTIYNHLPPTDAY